MTWLQTTSGRAFDLLNPVWRQVDIEIDIQESRLGDLRRFRWSCLPASGRIGSTSFSNNYGNTVANFKIFVEPGLVFVFVEPADMKPGLFNILLQTAGLPGGRSRQLHPVHNRGKDSIRSNPGTASFAVVHVHIKNKHEKSCEFYFLCCVAVTCFYENVI